MDNTSFEKIAKALNSASLGNPESIVVKNQSLFGPKPIFKEIEAYIPEDVYSPLQKTTKVKVKCIDSSEECDFELPIYESIGALKCMIYKKLDINPLDQKLVLGSKTLCEYKLLSEYTNSDSIRIILSTKTFANKKDPKPKASTEGAGADAKAPKNIPVVDKALLFEEVRSAILFRVKDRDLSEKLYNSFCETSHKLIPEQKASSTKIE